MSDEEFDLEDLLYYQSLSAQEKLEYLEQLLLFLQKITPKEAVRTSRILKDEGY